MKTIDLASRGILPGSNITRALYDLVEENPQDTTFVFAPGDYYFTPEFAYDYRLSNTTVLPERKLGIWLRNKRNLEFNFGMSTLHFSGHMQPFTLDHSENITLKYAVVDWDKPLVAEGIVRAIGEDTVDLYVDPVAFPHRLAGDWLEFDTGNGEWYPMGRWSHIQFDHATRTVTRGTGDNFVPTSVEALGDFVYRFTMKQPEATKTMAVGNIFVLRHNERWHAGAFMEKCQNITLQDITFHSCGGLGCLAQFSQDLTFKRVHFLPNRQQGRLISNGRDDGMHITCCSGEITIEECSFLGLMDDPINVHSCCVTAERVVDEKTILCRYMHPQAVGFHYWAEPGDEMVFIDRRDMAPIGGGIVADYALAQDPALFTLTFREAIPADLLAALDTEGLVAVDNLTHTAAFTARNNRFGSCRARGILVSTPKPVRIIDNYFASSGAAILVAGDSNYWFESGECHDVEIAGNVFTDACLSSPYQFGEGMVSICPVVPKPNTQKPFHKNIRIHDNIFDTPDIPVLYALSCGGLTFQNNRITKSPGAESWLPYKHLVRLDHCRDVEISDNTVIGPMNISGMELLDCDNVRGGI